MLRCKHQLLFRQTVLCQNFILKQGSSRNVPVQIKFRPGVKSLATISLIIRGFVKNACCDWAFGNPSNHTGNGIGHAQGAGVSITRLKDFAGVPNVGYAVADQRGWLDDEIAEGQPLGGSAPHR